MTTALDKSKQMDFSGLAILAKDLQLTGTTFTDGAILTRGSGVDAGETYITSVVRSGGIIKTEILIDLTGLLGSTTDLDIIGEDGIANCHWGQITTAVNGAIVGGRMTCLELPAGAVTDIDLYSATVATGTEDALITSLTETAIITAGGVWTNGAVKGFTTVPPANDYLYLANGAAGVPGTYTAGKFLIELWGTAA